PPKRLLEKIWSRRGVLGVPRNVLDSAERLRRELRPERGPVDWRPVAQRRRTAELLIEAVERYARSSGCRRARLVEYFGERLQHCAGCDRCGRRPRPMKASHEVACRVTRLHRALAGERSLWGGSPLEPDVLLRLAEYPPHDAGSLADVPGVGPAVAERLGGRILAALAGSDSAAVGTGTSAISLVISLHNWRADVARRMGVAPYVVLTDSTVRAIVEARPTTREELARVRGVGPRTLAKFADDLLSRLRLSPAPENPSIAPNAADESGGHAGVQCTLQETCNPSVGYDQVG
ncbi:MAG TPA: HRDC domain-containing protein, partial [Gemmatimonadales bacterium]|nr:HRDC domain-containing protein [Gemmatimonadales bacterium]